MPRAIILALRGSFEDILINCLKRQRAQAVQWKKKKNTKTPPKKCERGTKKVMGRHETADEVKARELHVKGTENIWIFSSQEWAGPTKSSSLASPVIQKSWVIFKPFMLTGNNENKLDVTILPGTTNLIMKALSALVPGPETVTTTVRVHSL